MAKKTKNNPVKETESKVQDSIIKISKFISGEKSLEKKQEKLEEIKTQAMNRQVENEIPTEAYQNSSNEFPSEQSLRADPTPRTKVVQNVKLYDWKAPIRQTFPFDMKTFMAIVAASLIFIIYLAILGNYGLMAVIIALLFFIYAAGTTKPVDVKHRITARGIDTPISLDEDGEESLATSKLYEWYMLDDFAFFEKNNQILLVIRTKLNIPSKLIMLVDEEQQKDLFMLLQDKLLYKDVRKQNKLDIILSGKYFKLEDI